VEPDTTNQRLVESPANTTACPVTPRELEITKRVDPGKPTPGNTNRQAVVVVSILTVVALAHSNVPTLMPFLGGQGMVGVWDVDVAEDRTLSPEGARTIAAAVDVWVVIMPGPHICAM
jgi:hypothetical protein